MISDEKGLLDVKTFEYLFSMYFKAEKNKDKIIRELMPIITVEVEKDSNGDLQVKKEQPEVTKYNFNAKNRMVVIQKLTQFIDLFNYFPLKVNKMRQKNDSNELQYIMSSNKKGSKDILKQ